MIVVSVLQKADRQPLTKRISLTPDGAVISDGSACVMTRGNARRFGFKDIDELGSLIEVVWPRSSVDAGSTALRSAEAGANHNQK
jgi:hypothetical protein